jgi:hypothetical protein
MAMERNEALETLGLGTKATEQEIEHRYAILVKRFKNSDDPTALAKVTDAYDFLTGRTYVPEPPDPRDAKVVLGKTVRQWKHLWEYGRMKYLAIVAIAAAVVSIAYSIITNTPPDLKFLTLGEIITADGNDLENYLATAMPELKKIQKDGAYITRTGDGANDFVNVQKAFVLIAAGDEDILVLDDVQARNYGMEGGFKELDDFYATLRSELPASILAGIVPVEYTITTDNGGDGKPHVYGLDVTGLGTVQAVGIYGNRVIFSISIRTKHLSASETFLRKFLADTEALKLLVTPMPTAEPTSATPAAASPTPAG